MSEAFAHLDAHAYVDNSLTPSERAAFEAALRREPKLRARVEAWEAQNEAIRLAFGASARPRQLPALGRASNENTRILNAPRPMRGRAMVRPLPLPAPRRRRPIAIAGVALLAGLTVCLNGAVDPRAALLPRAESALRSALAFGDSRLDFVTTDPRALSAWLGARFGRVEPSRLAPKGWSLLGARIVPGLSSGAAMALYETGAGDRAALLIEPTDALPAAPAIYSRWGDKSVYAGLGSGFSYAVAGPTRAGVAALIPARN